MPNTITDKLVTWGDDFEDQAIEQARRSSELPFIAGHIALMPDAHWGLGATVGSVIPTSGAIIPAAVGVDIGCGMIAAELDLTAGQLPDSLDSLLSDIGSVVPAGLAQGHQRASGAAERWFGQRPAPQELTHKQTRTVMRQFGTLGSGNHFLEVCVDEREVVWVVLHSGSRGIGNQLARQHIETAKKLAKRWMIPLADPDLAYLPEGTDEFDAYIRAMLWAQDYALANREAMMDATLRVLTERLGHQFTEVARINCHHNYTVREHHHGRNVWLTRKGAIRAGENDRGVIPGSMGTASFIVRGKGNPASYESCSHGAGRRMGRKAAKREFSGDDLTERMRGKAWNRDRAADLVDEIPDAYKDVRSVMAAQEDLVTIEHTLTQVLNYKG